VDVEVGKAMMAARQAMEPTMTQKDLATKVNEKPSVINDYESGRAIPSQQVLAKLERTLGVKLRGKGLFSIPLYVAKKGHKTNFLVLIDIGSPLGPRGKGGSSK